MATFGARVKKRRKQLGLSQAALGAQVGRTSAAVSNWERAYDKPDPEIIERLAEVLETTPELLLFGLKESEEESRVQVAGAIRAGGIMGPHSKRTPATVPRAPGLGSKPVVALQIENGHNAPVYRDGDMVYIPAGAGSPPESYLEEDVLAELEDGRKLLRHLTPGSSADTFTLEAYAGQPMIGVRIKAVWPILSVVRATARERN